MATTQASKFLYCALWFAPLVIVPLTFFACLPWLRRLDNTAVMGITVATALFVMGYAVFLASRINRRLDEVELAGQRFATTKGMTIGSFATVFVIMFPPALNSLADLALSIGSESPEKAVRVAITIGFMLVVLLQVLGVFVMAAWWGRHVIGSQS